jgi:hypothetical protein
MKSTLTVSCLSCTHRRSFIDLYYFCNTTVLQNSVAGFYIFNAPFLTIRYYTSYKQLPSSLLQSVAACLYQVPTDVQFALPLLALNALSDNGHNSIGFSSSFLARTVLPSTVSLRFQSRCFLTESRQRDKRKLVESNHRWTSHYFLSTGGGKC